METIGGTLMSSKHSILVASSAMAFAAFAGIAGQVPAQADPLPYGPDTCIQGFVWREARPGDTVCVTPDVRSTVAQQNSTPGANRTLTPGPGHSHARRATSGGRPSTATPPA